MATLKIAKPFLNIYLMSLEPIFVLSTGRVGTMLLTRLFELEKGLTYRTRSTS
jgi:hypothetical protein